MWLVSILKTTSHVIFCKHTTYGLKPAWILGLLVRGFFKLYQQAVFTSQPPEFIMNSYCSHLPGGSLLQNHCCSRASPEG